MNSIGVVGCGFVGGAIAKGFQHYADEVRAYDIDESKATHSFEDTVKCDVVFVCLPTPMKSVTGAECNLSIIEGFFAQAKDLNPTGVFVIKSTVPVGTTQRMNKEFPSLNIVHSPEFLTARTANIDFITPSRNIVGGYDEKSVKIVADIFKERFSGVPCYTMTAKESELVKYICNCFYATKIMFFNEMLLLSEKMRLNWDNIMDGVLSSGWISHMHTDVPGHDGQRGYGGTCFPKDINAMIAVMEEEGIDPKVLKAVWEQNLEVREDWDWQRFTSAVKDD
jgi:UDPglucose 6-dehydrogenase